MIRVLVVEDEPVAAEAHRAYVDRTPGFTTAAVAGTGAAALTALARQPVDLVLLDMNLPDGHGIDLCRRIRGAGAQVDVLAVTSARELATVRAAGEGLSAAETAELIGASRITARRYLEYLADTGLVDRAPRYGGAGRPELEYRWR